MLGMGEDTTMHNPLSRRTFFQRAAVATIATAAIAPMSFIARSAAAQNGDIELVCTSDGVRLRDNPGLASNVLAYVNSGEVVNQIGDTVDADGYTWIPVSLQRDRNMTGWVASDFFERGGTTGWPAGTDVHVTSDDVNLRTGPGLGYGVIASFDANTNAGIVGGPQNADGYAWYKIGIEGVSGWMVSDFLAEGHVGAAPGFPEGAWVWTTSDVNLRSGPGLGNGVIATYGYHEAAYVISGPQSVDGYNWYKVEMANDGNVGWMAGELLDYAPTEPTGSRLEVVDGPLNLRESPDTTAAIITTLATGEVVVIRDASFVSNDGYTWANVYVERNPDIVGWVARDFTRQL
jgi:uncharacterized protein YgiM (DUF1202 family)